jgi:hypothetical protein
MNIFFSLSESCESSDRPDFSVGRNMGRWGASVEEDRVVNMDSNLVEEERSGWVDRRRCPRLRLRACQKFQSLYVY